MSIDPIGAAAEGMLQFTRRRFLGQLGIAAGAAVTTTSAVAIEHAMRPEENPVLLDIGARLDELDVAFEETKQRRLDAIAYFETHKPEVPADLIVTHPDPFARDFSEWLVDVEGNRVKTTDGVMYTGTQVVMAYPIRRLMPQSDGRTMRGKRMRKLLPIAQQYEEEVENVRVASGYDAADHAHRRVIYSHLRLADEAAAAEAWTIDGLGIQGRAVLAVMKTGHDASYHSTRWTVPLAESAVAVGRRA